MHLVLGANTTWYLRVLALSLVTGTPGRPAEKNARVSLWSMHAVGPKVAAYCSGRVTTHL